MFRIHIYHHIQDEKTSRDESGEIMSAFTDLLNAKVGEIKASFQAHQKRVDALLKSLMDQNAELKQAIEAGNSDPVVLDELDEIRRDLDESHPEPTTDLTTEPMGPTSGQGGF